MDEKTFDQRTDELLNTFQDVRAELREAIEPEKGADRLVKIWDAMDRLTDEVFLKYKELSWDLYQENVQLNNDKLRD